MEQPILQLFTLKNKLKGLSWKTTQTLIYRLLYVGHLRYVSSLPQVIWYYCLNCYLSLWTLIFSFIAACAAESLATGTLNGEQDT